MKFFLMCVLAGILLIQNSVFAINSPTIFEKLEKGESVDREIEIIEKINRIKEYMSFEIELRKKLVGDDVVMIRGLEKKAREMLDIYKEHYFKKLDKIQEKWLKGEITPDKPSVKGYFPVAANPIHGGHFEPATNVFYDMTKKDGEKLGLDKVCFIVAASDPRKPYSMLDQKIRYPMFKYGIKNKSALFGFSDIASGTNYDGETNIGRIMAANKATDEEGSTYVYMVGSDHALVYEEEVIGKILDETDEYIKVEVQEGSKINKKIKDKAKKKSLFKKGETVTYQKKVPEYWEERLKDNRIKIRKLDTIGKLDDKVANGVRLYQTGERVYIGEQQTLKIVFIGRDPKELKINLGIAEE